MREFFHERDRLTEICRQHVDRVAGNPLREIDRRVMPGVESDQYAARHFADVFDRVAVTLRDVADIPLLSVSVR